MRLTGWMVALALAVAAMPLLLSLDHGLNFWSDDWNYIWALQTQGLASLIRPFGNHWYGIPTMIWWTLLSTVGLRSYVPYLVVLLAMHIATCLALFALIRRRAGSTVALVSMTIVLFGGYGSDVINWAIMVTYLGSTLFGLLALLLLDGPATDWRRAILAGALLLAGTASSGMGLGFVIVAAVELALDPNRRRYLPALVLPAAGFLAWFAFFGLHSDHNGIGTPGSLWQTAGLGAAFVRDDVLAGSAAIFGLPAMAGLVGAGLIALTLALTRRVDHRSLALGAGLVAQFMLAAAARAAGGFASPPPPRYIYIASVYLLLLIAPAAARIFSVRMPWKIAPAAVAVFAVALNLCTLAGATQIQRDTISFEGVELQTVDAFRGSPDLNQDALIDDWLPSVRTYLALTASHGSPVARVSQADVSRLPGIAVDHAISHVFGLRSVAGTAPSAAAGCQETARADGPGGGSVLTGSSGSWIDVGATPGARTQLFLWLAQGPQQQPTATVTVPASGWEAIGLPRTTQPVTWYLRVQSTAPIQAWSCDTP